MGFLILSFLLLSVPRLFLAGINVRKILDSFLVSVLFDFVGVFSEWVVFLVLHAAGGSDVLFFKPLWVGRNGFLESFVVIDGFSNVFFGLLVVVCLFVLVVQLTCCYSFGMRIAGLVCVFAFPLHRFFFFVEEVFEFFVVQYFVYGVGVCVSVLVFWVVVEPLVFSCCVFLAYDFGVDIPVVFTDLSLMWVAGRDGGFFASVPAFLFRFFRAVGVFFLSLLLAFQRDFGSVLWLGSCVGVGGVGVTVPYLGFLVWVVFGVG
ncbi:hypothetical protein [Algoriphagus yeomjeoni]|uniref:hypothetical protein n=1 Tax=Algoriphagus yeomjeoni TaxID=291403 RepID=UPI0011B946C8|nr:hypothetical protein [Algoriphagus yeomjeoni]